jgi:dTDP-4-amino-4,6-dideoxygalactose transaminase
MNVNLLDLKAQNGALEPELNEAFLRVLRSGHFILGPEVERFERALAEFTGAKHALGVSSGTDAILVALMALGIGPGDEVLCPSFTFFATAGCVARVGATPVFVDSCPVCFNLDVRDAARRITPRTKAIIPVHLFGQAAEMDGVLELAAKSGLKIIEDAAQAMGATYRGKQVGTLGDFGTISFFPTKNLGALGDAGALLANDTALFERAKILRMHGMEPKYYHQVVGGNFRLDALQAAMLSVKLPHFNGYTAARC